MTIIKRFTKNTAGRDIIVGDVHGHFSKLRAALDAIAFDGDRDRLFSVGDLVDRGPESEAVIDWLCKPWFHSIMGNHELMALEFHAGVGNPVLYGINGGAWLISKTEAERLPYFDAISQLPMAIELETDAGLVVLVHADMPAPTWAEVRYRLVEDKDDRAVAALGCIMWGRDRIDNDWTDVVHDVRAIVHGHTPVDKHTVLGNVHYIDSGAWLPAHRARPFILLDAATLTPLSS